MAIPCCSSSLSPVPHSEPCCHLPGCRRGERPSGKVGYTLWLSWHQSWVPPLTEPRAERTFSPFLLVAILFRSFTWALMRPVLFQGRGKISSVVIRSLKCIRYWSPPSVRYARSWRCHGKQRCLPHTEDDMELSSLLPHGNKSITLIFTCLLLWMEN